MTYTKEEHGTTAGICHDCDGIIHPGLSYYVETVGEHVYCAHCGDPENATDKTKKTITLEMLDIVADFDWVEASYEYDETRIYHAGRTGQLFYASDSGCSCTLPFEDIKTISDLTELENLQAVFDMFKEQRDSRCTHKDVYNYNTSEYETHTPDTCPLMFRIVGVIEKLHGKGIR